MYKNYKEAIEDALASIKDRNLKTITRKAYVIDNNGSRKNVYIVELSTENESKAEQLMYVIEDSIIDTFDDEHIIDNIYVATEADISDDSYDDLDPDYRDNCVIICEFAYPIEDADQDLQESYRLKNRKHFSESEGRPTLYTLNSNVGADDEVLDFLGNQVDYEDFSDRELDKKRQKFIEDAWNDETESWIYDFVSMVTREDLYAIRDDLTNNIISQIRHYIKQGYESGVENLGDNLRILSKVSNFKIQDEPKKFKEDVRSHIGILYELRDAINSLQGSSYQTSNYVTDAIFAGRNRQKEYNALAKIGSTALKHSECGKDKDIWQRILELVDEAREDLRKLQ